VTFAIYLQLKIACRYVIPPEYGRQFEQLVVKLFPEEAASCPAFLRHKMIVVSPQVLNKHSIPFSTVRIHITYYVIYIIIINNFRLDKQHIFLRVLFVSGNAEAR